MKIIWSKLASEALKDIYQYHKEIAGIKIAKNLKEIIFDSTKQLKTHPNSGQAEETLKQLRQKHRYLIRGNYKIIYRRIKEGILITDIFDTRQNPVKINSPKR